MSEVDPTIVTDIDSIVSNDCDLDNKIENERTDVKNKTKTGNEERGLATKKDDSGKKQNGFEVYKSDKASDASVNNDVIIGRHDDRKGVPGNATNNSDKLESNGEKKTLAQKGEKSTKKKKMQKENANGNVKEDGEKKKKKKKKKKKGGGCDDELVVKAGRDGETSSSTAKDRSDNRNNDDTNCNSANDVPHKSTKNEPGDKIIIDDANNKESSICPAESITDGDDRKNNSSDSGHPTQLDNKVDKERPDVPNVQIEEECRSKSDTSKPEKELSQSPIPESNDKLNQINSSPHNDQTLNKDTVSNSDDNPESKTGEGNGNEIVKEDTSIITNEFSQSVSKDRIDSSETDNFLDTIAEADEMSATIDDEQSHEQASGEQKSHIQNYNDDDGDNTSGSEDSRRGGEDKITGGGDKITGSGDKITGSGDKITGSGDKITESEDKITGSEDKITGGGDKITGSGDKITGSEDKITGSEDKITGSGDKITGSGEKRNVKNGNIERFDDNADKNDFNDVDKDNTDESDVDKSDDGEVDAGIMDNNSTVDGAKNSVIHMTNEQLVQRLQEQSEAMTRLQAHAHAQQVKANLLTTSLRAKLRRKDQELKLIQTEHEQQVAAVITHLLYLEAQMQKDQNEIYEVLYEKNDIIRRQKAAIEDLVSKNNGYLQALKETHGFAPDNGLVKVQHQIVEQNESISIQDHGNKIILRANKNKNGEKTQTSGHKVRFSAMKDRLRRHKSSLELYHHQPLEALKEKNVKYGSEENLVAHKTVRSGLYDRKERCRSLIDYPVSLFDVEEGQTESPDSCFSDDFSTPTIPRHDSTSSLVSLNEKTARNNGGFTSGSVYGFNELSKSRSVPHGLPTVAENDASPTNFKGRPHSLPSVELLAKDTISSAAAIPTTITSVPSPKTSPAPSVTSLSSSPPSESNPFKSFKNVFKRKGSKKKRAAAVTSGKEQTDVLKQHFKKYDMT